MLHSLVDSAEVCEEDGKVKYPAIKFSSYNKFSTFVAYILKWGCI